MKQAGTLKLVIVKSASTDGLPHYGDTITFDVATTASEPRVEVKGYVGGTLVYFAEQHFYGDFSTQDMVLSSRAWTSGPADCKAKLFHLDSHGRARTLATLDFHAEA